MRALTSSLSFLLISPASETCRRAFLISYLLCFFFIAFFILVVGSKIPAFLALKLVTDSLRSRVAGLLFLAEFGLFLILAAAKSTGGIRLVCFAAGLIGLSSICSASPLYSFRFS